jgi:rhodanese-related sulfurtransferase
MLRKRGITRVHPLEGGFDAWRAAGYAVETQRA